MKIKIKIKIKMRMRMRKKVIIKRDSDKVSDKKTSEVGS